MTRRCVIVDLGDGRTVSVQTNRQLSEADRALLREQMRSLADAVPDLTPEQAERQDAAMARVRERNARIRGAS